MIERMKKLTILVSENERFKFIAKLRKIGVLHIKHTIAPVHHEIHFIEDKISRIEKMIATLRLYERRHKLQIAGDTHEKDIFEQTDKIAEVNQEKHDFLNEAREIEKKMQWFKNWGEFDPDDLAALNEKGAHVRLYCLTKDQLKKMDPRQKFCIVKKEKGYTYIAIVTSDSTLNLPFDEALVPPIGVRKMEERIDQIASSIMRIEAFFQQEARTLDAVRTAEQKLKKERESLKVRFGMQEEGRFSYLEGYCPGKAVNEIKAIAAHHGLGLLIEDPKELEEVPTLITNPKWVNVIAPVFKFMNTLPGYGEFDISFPFLVFFSIFFAMLIGDAGYGILFLLATFLARRKLKQLPSEPFFLMYLLSICTIIWGALTGTYFGSEAIAELPFLKRFIISGISSFGQDNQRFMIFICFVIGVIQLTLAHILRGIRIANSIKIVAEIGWIMILWGMFFAAGKFVIDMAFPSFALWFLMVGAALALFFSNPENGILKGALLTLINLPLTVIGAFGDIVSYLRLFAVGYASFAIAASFNDLASTLGAGSIVGTFFAAMILFLGHTLNIVLGLMAVIVHGLRLNMLEFSSHLGMQWSGKKYEPFCE